MTSREPGESDSSTDTHGNEVPSRVRLSIVAAALLSFTGILTETSLNVTFTTMTRQFALPMSTVQTLTSGYLLMVTLAMSASAYLLRRFDARLLFRSAVIVSLVGLLLCALPVATSPSTFPVLLAGRLLQSVATGVATPLMMHVILTSVPLHLRGTYLGFAGMVISFAPALGPTYGGLVNHVTSWRLVFVLVMPVVVAAWILGERNLRLPARGVHGHRFDVVGLLLLAVVLIGITQAVDQAGANGPTSASALIPLAIAILAGVLAVHHALHDDAPLLNLRILANPVVGSRAVGYFVLQFTNIGSSFLLPVFLQTLSGIDSLTAGLLLLPGSLLGALVAPFAGSFYDHRGAKAVLLASHGLMLAGTLMLWALTASLTVPIVTVLYMLLRLGFNLGFGNTMTDASKVVDPSRQTDVNSLFNTIQQYAGSLGTSALSALLALGELRHPGDATAGAVAGAGDGFLLLVVLGAVALVGVVVSL
ncbi:MFS transporter, partial [uncultured Bifidobacterium sp.]|uniref:MFS transporter n=1 Tax=uncultured Bifidobacterium sp. TaxID=165187 RepID=UPI0028DC26FA